MRTIGVAETDVTPPRRREALLFLAALALELVVMGVLVAERRLVRAHDGYQYWSLQYYFLNGVVTAGEVPRWMPFMTHGTVATWWYASQAALLPSALSLAGGLVAGVTFFPIYHLGILVDELILLGGVWLLGRRFFASPVATFFTAVLVLGSTVWVLQPWWNLHLFHAVPLILHLVHRFLESGRWRHLALAANLLAVQTLGALPYFLPVTSVVVVFYVVAYVLLHPAGWGQVKALRSGASSHRSGASSHRWGAPALAALAAGGASLLLVSGALTIGTGQIVNYNLVRNLDGSTPLGSFLHYGGATGPVKWLELAYRISPSLDSTLYLGILALPFIVIGVGANTTRASAHLSATVVAILLFTSGTLLAHVLYYTWPLMRYFRHLGAVAVFAKLFLCFLGGLGVDAALRRPEDARARRRFRIAVWCGAAALGLAALWLGRLLASDSAAAWVTAPIENAEIRAELLDEDVVRRALREALGLALAGGAVILGMAAERLRRPMVALALVIAVADLATYKVAESRRHAVALTDEEYARLAFEPMPFVGRRCPAPPCRPDPRYDLLKPWPRPGAAQYWSSNSLLFEDEAGSVMRVDHWLRPLDRFMRAYWGQAIDDASVRPEGLLVSLQLRFPAEHPAAAKIAGLSEDKVQFFARAHLVDDAAAAAVMASPDYAGDALFVGRADGAPASSAAPWARGTPPPPARLRLPYRVERFDANHLVVSVEGAVEGAWMLYSDVWHPGWRASVNGRPTPVFTGNLAYKAVALERGRNRVHLSFESPLSVLSTVFGLNAVFWLGFLALSIVRIASARGGA